MLSNLLRCLLPIAPVSFSKTASISERFTKLYILAESLETTSFKTLYHSFLQQQSLLTALQACQAGGSREIILFEILHFPYLQQRILLTTQSSLLLFGIEDCNYAVQAGALWAVLATVVSLRC